MPKSYYREAVEESRPRPTEELRSEAMSAAYSLGAKLRRIDKNWPPNPRAVEMALGECQWLLGQIRVLYDRLGGDAAIELYDQGTAEIDRLTGGDGAAEEGGK